MIKRRFATTLLPRFFAGHLQRKSEANTRIRETTQLLSELARSIGHRQDDVFSQQVALRLAAVSDDVHRLIQGIITFGSTESWRTVYEEILAGCETKRYFSVALINSDGYWRDAAGKSSLQFNFQLVERGYLLHRLFILDEFFWPPGAELPSKDVFNWIYDQYNRGIAVSLVRASQLEEEPELACDFGIYGHRAVGYQRTDENGRTTHFELRFDPVSVEMAEQHWTQLQLFAVPIENLLNPDG